MLIEGNRALATVRKVKEIKPIEGADAIELAIVDGWQCVVKKGEFKVDQLGVYFEIDSFLPVMEPFLFLDKGGAKRYMDAVPGLRLKTIKLRGALSQGLLMPMQEIIKHWSKFRMIYKHNTSAFEENVFTEGCDLTDLLSVRKWEAPIPVQLQGQIFGAMPQFIRKTDQERCQNIKHLFDDYGYAEFELTEKLDGTSITVYCTDERMGVCGRNWEHTETDTNTPWKVIRSIKLLEAMKTVRESSQGNLAVQGELVGPGIQGNPLGLKANGFFCYDVWDIDKQRYMTPVERKIYITALRLCGSDIFEVPVIQETIRLNDVASTMDALLLYADGKSKLNPERDREGIVFKSYGLFKEQVFSFKAVSNKYLLGEKE